MRRFLLSAAVAMAAMVVSAQNRVNVGTLETLAPKVSQVMKAQSVVFADGKPMLKTPVAKEASNTVSFIEINVGFLSDRVTSVAETSEVQIVKTGETGEYKGEKMEIVNITGMGKGYATVTGYMTDTKLCVPYQKCFSYGEYGDMYIEALVLTDEGLSYGDRQDLVYNLNSETGRWEPESFSWIITMPNYGDGNSLWTYGQYTEMAKANGQEVGHLGKNGWSSYGNAVYIEDTADEIHIYNFFNTEIVLYPTGEDDGSVLIPTNQIMASLSSTIDQNVYGKSYNLYGVDVDDEGYLHQNRDKEYINAEFNGPNVIGYSENEYSVIFSTGVDAEGTGYYMGYQTAVTWTYDSNFLGCPTTGINEISTSNTTATGKMFNLAGLQVDKNFKGVVIRDGKKIVNK